MGAAELLDELDELDDEELDELDDEELDKLDDKGLDDDELDGLVDIELDTELDEGPGVTVTIKLDESVERAYSCTRFRPPQYALLSPEQTISEAPDWSGAKTGELSR